MFRKLRETVVGLVVAVLMVGLLVGPVMAYLGWSDGSHAARVMSEGVETKAVPESGTRRSGRRSGTSYSLNLAWQAADGTRMRAEGVSISSALAERVITGGRITRSSLNIKYLPSDPTHPVVLEDAETQRGVNDNLMYGGIAWFAGGLLALVGLRWTKRRRAAGAAQPA